MPEDVYLTFKRIFENRSTDLPEKMVDGYIGFLFRDKNGMPEVAMHWEHRFNHTVKQYNDIFRMQMPNITPHVCRHTYCSNQARMEHELGINGAKITVPHVGDLPDYAVIFVGKGNMYGHPHQETLDLLDDADVKVYRTDMNGDIIVHSDEKTLSMECSK